MSIGISWQCSVLGKSAYFPHWQIGFLQNKVFSVSWYLSMILFRPYFPLMRPLMRRNGHATFSSRNLLRGFYNIHWLYHHLPPVLPTRYCVVLWKHRANIPAVDENRVGRVTKYSRQRILKNSDPHKNKKKSGQNSGLIIRWPRRF